MSCVLVLFCYETQPLEIKTCAELCWGINKVKVTASQASRVSIQLCSDFASVAVYFINQSICLHLWLLEELNIPEIFSHFQRLIMP